MAVTVDIDTIRVLVGDTDTSSEIISDDQIALVVDGYTSTNLAAAAVANAIAGFYSRKVTFSVEGLSIQNSTKADNYRKLALQLRLAAQTESSSELDVSVLGVSKSEMETNDADLDRTDSRFKRGMHEYPGSNDTPETPD